MSTISESKQIRRVIERIARDVIRAETRNCIRARKAVVVSEPDGKTCTVRLIGETATLDLPYSSRVADVTQNETVLVATFGNNLANSVVWERTSFK